VAENSLLSPQHPLSPGSSGSPKPSEGGSVLSTPSDDPSLPQPHPIIEEVRQMDLFSMTPLEALNRLADLQRRLQSPIEEDSKT